MLIWTGTQGKIKINSAMKPISKVPRAMFAPFAPVTAAIVNRAEWVGYTLVTPDPREDRLLYNLPNALSIEWLAPTAHVSRAIFSMADGRRLAADFSEDGTPAETDATRTSLLAAETNIVEKIVVDVAIKGAGDSCACEPLAVEWLAWQNRHSTLRTAIARSAKDLDAVVHAISELAALLLTYNDDSTYTDTLGFDAAQEVEAAYVIKSAERQAHRLRGGDDRITHPKTVRAMMDVGSLTDEDMLAYLRSRGYELVSDAYPEYKNFAW